MKQALVVVTCPACEAPVEVDQNELEEGDCLICDQCDEAFTVISLDPLTVALDEDDVDDDSMGDDDEDLDDEDEDSDDLEDDEEDEDELDDDE